MRSREEPLRISVPYRALGQVRMAPALGAGTVLLTAVLLLALVTRTTGLGVFALPFVASAAVVAMAPTAPPARPAAVVPAYAAAAGVALPVAALAGPSMYAAAGAAALTLVLMVLLGAPHVPAVVAAAAIELNDVGPAYVLTALLPALVIVVGTALLVARVLPAYSYPASWR